MKSEATDGDYWLYHNHMPMRVYCHSLASSPKGYITLGNPENNYVENKHIDASTKFTRVALDPQVGHQRANQSIV